MPRLQGLRMRPRQSARPLAGSTIVTAAESARFKAYAHRVGRRIAAQRLGCGLTTLESACDQGTVAKPTWERLKLALTIAEAAL